MRVLSIGCGYVGLALSRELIARGGQLTALRRSAGDPAASTVPGLEWWSADITRPDTLPRLTRPFEAVVQCVAAGGGGADDYRRTYLEGTRHVLEWLAATPPGKFVYTSSTGVYGQDDGSVVDETSPTAPSSATAEILIATEQLLLEASRARGFPAIILRLSGIYGPGRGYWLRQFLSGEARLEGDGRRVLNMVHREDVVGAVVAALERGTPGTIYNVTDNEPVTQSALFRWLAARLGRPFPPPAEADLIATRRRGVTNKRVSNLRLREELGYALKYPTFREGFEAELRSLGQDQ
jgi:nucleoside-diphosphate-sugar epimerase